MLSRHLSQSCHLELFHLDVLPCADSRVLNRGHVHLDREVLVILNRLFVLVCPIDHPLVDVEDATFIHEESVEPEVECLLVAVVKLNANVIVDEKVFLASNVEIVVAGTAQVALSFLLLLFPVVKDVPFANDLEVWIHATFFQVWNRDHSYLVDFLDYSLVWDKRLLMAHLRWLHFQKVLKVVDVTDLRWYGHTLPIDSTDLSIVKESLVSRLADLIKD